jgi:hypothetical protein
VELADGSYFLCPKQVNPQLVEGTKRSLLPVSKTTVYGTGLDGNLESDDKVIPVKSTGGVPIETVPYHSLESLDS